jgi:hypothetical protein
MRGLGDRLRETLQLKRAEEPGWGAAAAARSLPRGRGPGRESASEPEAAWVTAGQPRRA